MTPKARIASILKAPCLGTAVTGIRSFEPQLLTLETLPEVALPNNLRLGHLVEKAFGQLIDHSMNYRLLHENLQVKAEGRTIGELDFIIEHAETSETLHLEVAYKFYLLDPSVAGGAIESWIGPNRRDALIQKIQKLKQKQLPLLYHPEVEKTLGSDLVRECTQVVCFMAFLFVPHNWKGKTNQALAHAISGHYLTYAAFAEQDHTEVEYHLPKKTQWGIDPAACKQWLHYTELAEQLETNKRDKRSVLCWQKHEESFSAFFLVWW